MCVTSSYSTRVDILPAVVGDRRATILLLLLLLLSVYARAPFLIRARTGAFIYFRSYDCVKAVRTRGPRGHDDAECMYIFNPSRLNNKRGAALQCVM